MSQKDLQFIERALAHPWMFWVYFWKWPRIVRQACAEYDLLAKERDAAKAAHERSERANKIVRDWIHVTHRLSTTPEAIRAIFAAGKRLSILLVFFVVTNTYGQAPPYLRNQWTTNANPLALKVISTNGVHAATNVWELDFTNTATVTVSAVSNANKVMVSFTGATNTGGGGDTIWTNDTSSGISSFQIKGDAGIRLFTNDSTAILVGTYNGGLLFYVTNGTDYFEIGGPGLFAGELTDTFTNKISIYEGGIGTAFFDRVTNSQFDVFAGLAASSMRQSSGVMMYVDTGSLLGGEINSSRGALPPGTSTRLSAVHGAIVAGSINQSTGIIFRVFTGGIGSCYVNNTTNMLSDSGGGAFVLVHADGASNANVLANSGSMAMGMLKGQNENLIAQGVDVGAFAFGRDVVATNAWLFGLHGTNITPFSLALANNGLQFQVTSNGNIGTIRGVTGYSWPTAHAAGVWTNDGAGVTGWKPLSDFASGGGIASIYTNNVLAGGPGLTELEFTNTATVTATATTNAGRVTMSFSASAASAGGTNKQVQFNNEGALAGATNLSWDLANSRLGVNKANPTVTLDVSGKIQANDQISTASGASIGWNGTVFFFVDTAGSMIIGNATFSDWGTLAFGNRTAPFPGLTRVAGHLAMRDGTGANSTNSFIFGNTVNTTASTGMTMNRQTGRVRLSAGNQTYLVTNNLATANSIVTATINSDDTTAVSVKAIPAAGVITLKANAATTADTDISFFISAP